MYYIGKFVGNRSVKVKCAYDKQVINLQPVLTCYFAITCKCLKWNQLTKNLCRPKRQRLVTDGYLIRNTYRSGSQINFACINIFQYFTILLQWASYTFPVWITPTNHCVTAEKNISWSSSSTFLCKHLDCSILIVWISMNIQLQQ